MHQCASVHDTHVVMVSFVMITDLTDPQLFSELVQYIIAPIAQLIHAVLDSIPNLFIVCFDKKFLEGTAVPINLYIKITSRL